MEITHYSQEFCHACEEMKPELRKLKKAGFKINVVDCDKTPSNCKGIKFTPTLIIKKGSKSKRINGFATADEIKRKFDRL